MKDTAKIRLKKKKLLLVSLIGVLLVLLFLNYTIGLGDYRKTEAPCLFCDIANKSLLPKLEYETDEYVIFKDKYPASTHHYLAVPKLHFESIKVLNRSHVGLVQRMHNGMVEFLIAKGIDTSKAVIGYHIPPFISQKHLHLHGISPPSEMSFWNRISFMSPSFWFKSSQNTLDSLKRLDL
ncbi:CG15362 [Drosophila busckii]|uniref:Adenosine 5'-monophosphoramidase HINT3 n=1 Tax=Drosophila busckii TaxID=30019 RepID=A0A0M4EDL6_DROBS|nr:histidine triad nucleotide-binding protein 3 [Drosophila busckii]ALC38005.1 CG15362 [Drosophila busckii]